MVKTQKRLRKTALKLSMAAMAFASLGVAVVAAPSMMDRSHMVATMQPLAVGPAMQLAKAGPGASEDCVRVTRMVGPDGKEYPTNGMVCSGE